MAFDCLHAYLPLNPLATGLYYLSELVEEYSVLSKKIIKLSLLVCIMYCFVMCEVRILDTGMDLASPSTGASLVPRFELLTCSSSAYCYFRLLLFCTLYYGWKVQMMLEGG